MTVANDTRTDLEPGWPRRTVGPVLRNALHRVRLPSRSLSAAWCLGLAGACFLGAALIAVLAVFVVVDRDVRLMAMLLGILACGLTLLLPVPGLWWETVSEAAAAPVPAPADPEPAPVAVWVAPEPLWRCVEPLPHDGRPMSVQVAQRLREAIDAGRLVPGAALPSDVDIARHLNVSAGVVNRAKNEIRSDGYLNKRPGTKFIIVNARRPPEHGAGSATRT